MPKPLELPALYAIVDVDVAAKAGWTPHALTEAYLAGGARLIQLRAKTLDSGPFLALAESIVGLAHAAGARVIINDRADVAVLSGADGVHVGQDDLRPGDVRRVTGDRLLVGLSTHSVAQITAALHEPVSYIAVGPIFGTVTKDTGYAAVGLDLIERAAAAAAPQALPVVAIGGITLERAGQVWRAGAASAAVITDLIGDDPAARVAEFVRVAGRER